MRLSKLALVVVAVSVLFGAIVSVASARTIELSSQTFTVTFTSVRFRGIFGTTECVMTLAGSFHSRNTAKVARTLIGFFNDARLGACPFGTATLLRETLPWHLQYTSFEGTLPNITKISTDVIGFSYRIRTPEGFNCLLRSTAAEPGRTEYTDNSSRQISSAIFGGTIETNCGFPGTFASAGGTVRGAGGAVIAVRLI